MLSFGQLYFVFCAYNPSYCGLPTADNPESLLNPQLLLIEPVFGNERLHHFGDEVFNGLTGLNHFADIG